MDSPFGSLDPIYQQQIAKNIPRLADQVVIMVTQSQWTKEVEGASSDRIGASYVLTYFSPKKDIKRKTIEIAGGTYDVLKQSPNDFEYTQIMEVNRG